VPTVGRADVVLPMAFNFEVGGTTITGSGEIIAVDAVADAPGEAVSAGVIAEALAKTLGITGVARGVGRSKLEATPAGDASALTGRGQPPLVAAGMGEMVAVTHSDAIHYHTGSLTSLCAWPRFIAPNVVAAISAADAEALGVKHNGRVRVVSAEGQAEATADVSKMQPAGVVAVSSGFGPARGLFPWSAARRTGPAVVKVTVA
jgi:anaerobic selenocysteine-containing dehydrogenase